MINSKYPFLICPGVQKSGTTYLYNLLKQSGDFCFSVYKETHFFAHDSKYEAGIEAFYKRFKPNEKTKYLADFSQSYLSDQESLIRIKKHLGDNVKMILILRDPVKRAFSNYRMLLLEGRENRSFHDVIMSEINKNEVCRNIATRGLYAEQLDNLLKLFSPEKIMMLEFSEFTDNPEKAVSEIFNFTGIEMPDKINYNVGQFNSKSRQLAGIGKKLFFIKTSKKSFVYNNKILYFIYRGIIYITRKKLETKPVLEKRTIDLLSEYYKESNTILSEKYDINTENWL